MPSKTALDIVEEPSPMTVQRQASYEPQQWTMHMNGVAPAVPHGADMPAIRVEGSAKAMEEPAPAEVELVERILVRVIVGVCRTAGSGIGLHEPAQAREVEALSHGDHPAWRLRADTMAAQPRVPSASVSRDAPPRAP
jgi:hypothetical protein